MGTLTWKSVWGRTSEGIRNVEYRCGIDSVGQWLGNDVGPPQQMDYARQRLFSLGQWLDNKTLDTIKEEFGFRLAVLKWIAG